MLERALTILGYARILSRDLTEFLHLVARIRGWAVRGFSDRRMCLQRSIVNFEGDSEEDDTCLRTW